MEEDTKDSIDDLIFSGPGAPKPYVHGRQEKSNPVPTMVVPDPEKLSMEDKINLILEMNGKKSQACVADVF